MCKYILYCNFDGPVSKSAEIYLTPSCMSQTTISLYGLNHNYLQKCCNLCKTTVSKAGIVLHSTSANNRTLVTRAVNVLLWLCDALLLTPSISKIHTIKLVTTQSQHAT